MNQGSSSRVMTYSIGQQLPRCLIGTEEIVGRFWALSYVSIEEDANSPTLALRLLVKVDAFSGERRSLRFNSRPRRIDE